MRIKASRAGKSWDEARKEAIKAAKKACKDKFGWRGYRRYADGQKFKDEYTVGALRNNRYTRKRRGDAETKRPKHGKIES